MQLVEWILIETLIQLTSKGKFEVELMHLHLVMCCVRPGATMFTLEDTFALSNKTVTFGYKKNNTRK